MSDLGTMALEYGERIDFERLRRERLTRALAEMKRDDLDALILGREANARYVSGARRLWTVGMRPFGPGCVVLREPRAVHLLTTWDEGIPAEIPHENLFPTTWSPENLMAHLREIPGLGDARRIGVDGMTPLFDQLLRVALPKAELADGSAALQRARARKTPDEIACLRTAVVLAESALAAVVPRIRPGTGERVLVGHFHAEAARLGVTVPAFEASFCATPRTASPGAPPTPRRISADRPLSAGDLVACHAGVMYAGYEGGVGRSYRCGDGEPTRAQRDLARRLDDLREALQSACRPGARTSEVCRAYDRCGEPRPAFSILQGVGLGAEPPIAGPTGDPADATLEPDTVLALQAYVFAEGVGGCFARDTLHLTQEATLPLNTPSSAVL